MPIVGLTDVEAAFPIIGKLHKGAEKSPKRPGRELPYFRFTSEDESLVDKFYSAFGEQPTSIPVMIPYHSVESTFPAWQEEWVKGGLVHRCDGRHVVIYFDGENYIRPTPGEMECPYASGKRKPTKANPGCGPRATLRVFIPKLNEMGIVELSTGGFYDISEMSANLKMYAQFRNGSLYGLHGFLYRKEVERSMKDADGNRVRRKKYDVRFKAILDQQSLTQNALSAPSSSLLLDVEEVYEDDDDEVIEDEVEVVDNHEYSGHNKSLHVMGSALYGKYWDYVRHNWVKGKASSKDWTPEEQEMVINTLRQKMSRIHLDKVDEEGVPYILTHLNKLYFNIMGGGEGWSKEDIAVFYQEMKDNAFLDGHVQVSNLTKAFINLIENNILLEDVIGEYIGLEPIGDEDLIPF